MLDNLPEGRSARERVIQEYWKKNQIFEKSVLLPASKSPKDTYSFYDGPPFATGVPHHGHIMAGTVKDAIPRYQTMKGSSVRRIWGWDCHGLPIENLIEKELGLNSKKDIIEYGVDKFNEKAEASVMQFEHVWKEQIPRLGRFVDMDGSYKTMDWTFTESAWWVWKSLYEKGLAYEGHKIMHICPRCETPLAQSEVGMEYTDTTDMSVTAIFPLVDHPLNASILAWTTTPWTLPGNTALAVNASIRYVTVKQEKEGVPNYYILAKSRYADYFKNGEEVVEEVAGSNLVGMAYTPPFGYFYEETKSSTVAAFKIWHADFINDESGTGIAHQAPAFGEEDMNLAKINGIPVIKHVNMDGSFTERVIDFAGLKVKSKGDSMSTDIEIVKWLAHNGRLFEKHKIIHSYPLCWRCKTPLLNYATSSWFVNVPQIKDAMLTENEKIKWSPDHIKHGRFGKWIEGAREWAVSRRRFWGAPLPVWSCDSCKNMSVIGSIDELRKHIPLKNTYILMRHGEAMSNIEGYVDSGVNENNHLTEEGEKQVRESLKNIDGVDLVVSSAVLRASLTADKVSQAKGVPVLHDERLKEFDFGVYDGKSSAEWTSSDEHKKYLKSVSYKVDGGESRMDVMSRMTRVLLDLEKEYEGKKIMIVSHGTPLYLLAANIHAFSPQQICEAKPLPHNNSFIIANAETFELPSNRPPLNRLGLIDLHRPYIDEVVIDCTCGSQMNRVPDVFDCWYESGSMPYGQLHYPFENKEVFDKNFPADWIAESLDQTRGWFYSLLVLGVALFGKSPFKAVNVNGLVMASDGSKMSKSLMNYVDPMLVVEKYGADTVRHYLLSTPVTHGENINFSDALLDEVHKKFMSRVENMLGLFVMQSGGEQNTSAINAAALSDHSMDRYAIALVSKAEASVTKGYDAYAIDNSLRAVEILVEDLSLWYVRRSRDRFKAGDTQSFEALKTFATVIQRLSVLIAPSTPFLAEYLYQSVAKYVNESYESVHLLAWPEQCEVDTELIDQMNIARSLVTQILESRTENKIPVKQPLASFIAPSNLSPEIMSEVLSETNVKHFVFGEKFSLNLEISLELAREGAVRGLMRAIQENRKNLGLIASDKITVVICGMLLSYSEVEVVSKKCGVEKISYSDTSLANVLALDGEMVSFLVTLV